MNTDDIVLEIDAEISRLQQARTLLSGTDTIVKPARPAGSRVPSKTKAVHSMSTEARAKIAAAQKLRWAKTKKAARNVATVRAVKGPAPNGAVPKFASTKKAVSNKTGQAKTKIQVTPSE